MNLDILTGTVRALVPEHGMKPLKRLMCKGFREFKGNSA
jgi:hypothetical protein